MGKERRKKGKETEAEEEAGRAEQGSQQRRKPNKKAEEKAEEEEEETTEARAREKPEVGTEEGQRGGMGVVSYYAAPLESQQSGISRSPAAPNLNAVGDRRRQTGVARPVLVLVREDFSILTCEPPG